MESKRQQQVAELILRNFSFVLQQEGLYIYGKQPLVTVGSVSYTHLSTWKWLDLHRNFAQKPTYRYLYSKPRPAPADNPQAALAKGAPHACEIEYCMGNLDLVKSFSWTKDDYKVSETMMNYFANFIKTGNPNGTGLPEWPMMKANEGITPVMVIHTESMYKNSTIEERYKLLDKYYKN